MNFLLIVIVTIASLVAGADESSFSVNPDIPYTNLVGSQTLLYQQVFGNSWGTPSNAQFNPEYTNFNRVVLELQVNSTGSNFDRLAQLYIDDIEIWRTSTAEPDNHGTTWTVRKDISHYGNLFKSNHIINFLIKNRVTNVYTGVFYVTLTAHFYSDFNEGLEVFDDNWAIDLNNLPDSIHALTKTQSTPSTSWSAPDDDITVNVGPLDRSVNRAVVHVFASGNGDDEFWWDNFHQASTSAGSSRFVDVYVGGTLAGFASPYPVIYTGGVNPYLWKPMVNLRTFDIPAYFIDITPFLPTLWNSETPISINVTNGIDNEKIPSNWIISYNLLTWSTAGQTNSGEVDEPEFSSHAPNGDSQASILVNRSLKTSASLTIGGTKRSVSWEQSVGFNNTLKSQNANSSYVWQNTQGCAAITGGQEFNSSFSYPFQCEVANNQYYRVQQSYDSTANGLSFSQWIDSSVSLDDQGTLGSASSRQYLSTPHGNHFAECKNLTKIEQW